VDKPGNIYNVKTAMKRREAMAESVAEPYMSILKLLFCLYHKKNNIVRIAITKIEAP
jgi:hypothetical protein